MKVDFRILVVFFLVALAASSLVSATTTDPDAVETPPAGPAGPVAEEAPRTAGQIQAVNGPLGDGYGGTIRGIVYEDLNGNEVYDEGEPGVEKAQVLLTDGFGAVKDQRLTKVDGLYRFEDLMPGSYCLEEVDPPGFGSSTINKICLSPLGEGQVIEHNFGDVRLPTATPTETPILSPTPTGTATPGPTSTASPTATPASYLDPSGAFSAYCQGVFWGDTTDKPNRVSQYGDLVWPETGPEDMYILIKTVASDLTVSIEGTNGQDMDVFLLSAPYPEDLVEGGDRGFTVPNLQPGTYYLMVDGYNGDAGPYRLVISCEGEPTITPTPTLSPTPTNTPVLCYEPLVFRQPTPTPTVTPTMVPYAQAVNCGSSTSYDASDGYTYRADRQFTAGAWGWQGAVSGVWPTTPITRDIGNTHDDPLYQIHRHSMNGYYFAVPNGRYEVLLRFAEIFPYANLGDRVFAVDIEGQRKLNQFDLLSKTTRYGAWDEKFTVDVKDGLLEITFAAQSPNYTPAINAIRVVRVQ
ncbi:MAG: hypothetical protein GX552_02615 [Chloroflexi bacterium]|nr:hypothetical protein [Chloroflexota bacterium]